MATQLGLTSTLHTVTIVGMPVGNVIGREHELGSVHAFLDRSVEGPAGFLFEGEPGIGKSTLWLAAVTSARERGLLVLSSRPAEAEQGLAHVGLGDLFEDVDDVVSELSMPRRRALEVALLREEAPDDPVDHRALGVAVRDVLNLLGERRPLLLAIDDVQWLDSSSSSALAFALRRLTESRILLLLARRVVDDVEPSELEQALDAERVERLPVGPLSVGALHRLLHDRFGRSFARQTLLRIHERSGGNPFYALELTRALDADIDPLEPLPVPETLDELVRARVAGLPAATRDALAVASALGAPSESLLERAGVAADALAPAAAARVIEYENGADSHTRFCRRCSTATWASGAGVFIDELQRSSRTRLPEPAISHWRPTRPTPRLPQYSTTPRRSLSSVAQPLTRPSSRSRRSG
jgi:hypothetical protein